MKKIFTIIPCFVAIMTGCASPVYLSPQAAKVIVAHGKPPKDCVYINQVMGNRIDLMAKYTGFTFDSDAELVENAMNDLRTKANAMGANYVQIIADHYGALHKYDNSQASTYTLGNAYTCKNLGVAF